MPRGAARSKQSPERAREAKDRAKAEKKRQLAASARASLPEDPEKRKEIFAERKAFKERVKDAQGDLKDYEKRMKDVFGMHPKAVKIKDIFEGIKDTHEYGLVHFQVSEFLKLEGRPIQAELDLPRNQVVDAGDPLFDQTKTGKAIGKARPVEAAAPQPEPPPQQPSPGIPLDEAQAAFEKASEGKFPTEEEIAAKNVAIAAQKLADEAAFEAKTESNVVQLPAPKKRGRPATVTPEEKKARLKAWREARKAEKQAEKKIANSGVKAAADRAEKASKSPKPPAVPPVARPPEGTSTVAPPSAPLADDDDIPPVYAADRPLFGPPGSNAEIIEPSGGYAISG